jgi:hypothetical protein
MAVTENPKIGRARNSIGNTVFSTQFGKNTMRTKPIEIANPKTPDQVMTRERFKKIFMLVRQVLKYVNAAYDGTVKGKSTHNHVMSINMKNCLIDNTCSVDPSLFMLCDHEGSFVENVVLNSPSANTIVGTFDSNAQNNDEDGDPVKAYGFYAEGDKIWQFNQSGIRGNGTLTLTRPDMSGLDIAIYFECLDRVNLLKGKPQHVIKYVGTVNVI